MSTYRGGADSKVHECIPVERGWRNRAATGEGWRCTYRDCHFTTSDISAVTRHALSNQWTAPAILPPELQLTPEQEALTVPEAA